MAELKKLIKDRQVAVIVSPGYGGGWSTWNSEYGNQLLFDPDIAESLLANDTQKAMRIASEKYPDVYTRGLPKAIVVWVNEGTRFTIKEYDGYESLEELGPDYGYTA